MDDKTIIKQLRSEIEVRREEMYKLHRSGSGGLEVVRRSAELMDQLIVEIYHFCRNKARENDLAVHNGMALVGLGGYGRGELNPHSDVDILFLYPKKRDPYINFMVKEALYILWDIGLHVGHSARSIRDCIDISRNDSSASTSMMESRHICGDELLTMELIGALQKEFHSDNTRDFIKNKAMERDRYHADYGDSVQYQEPNVKEGVGGLRDCHLALWCGMACCGVRKLDDLAGAGMLEEGELGHLFTAYDFIHRVRNELHFLARRRSDVLSIDVQQNVAANLGYENEDPFPAVERFMRDYFLNATVIERYSKLVMDKCNHQGWASTPRRKPPVRRDVDEGIFAQGGELMVEGNPFIENPIMLLKFFRHCQVLGLKPCQMALRDVRSNLHLLDQELKEGTGAYDIFLEILSDDGAAGTLGSMHEAGLLGKIIPEFQELTCLVQHDLFHHYTVDEHILRAMKHLEKLKNTKESELKELSSLFNRLGKPWLLKLALLLHDIGKIRGQSHTKEGVIIASRVLERFRNIGEDDKRVILLLIEHHLTMNHLAQRRNIKEEKIVTGFARQIENEVNLSLLYLLTYADMRGVGPEVWTVWKGALLWELYHETHNYFVRGGEAQSSWEDVLEDLQSRISYLLKGRCEAEEVKDFFHTMPYEYLTSTPQDKLARHLEIVHSLKEVTLAMDRSSDDKRGSIELVVCTHEKPGLFANIAGALSAMNININHARIYTGTNGVVLDILEVNALDRGLLEHEDSWHRVKKNMTRILDGEKTVDELMVGRKKPLDTLKAEYMEVTPQVTLDNNSSDTHTVLEIIAQDRLGLLYSLASTIFKEEASIYLAKISTEAHKVINVFYITDFHGRKIEDQQVLSRLKIELMDAIEQGD